MKKLSLILALAALTSNAFAQTIPTPEFKFKVMFVGSGNALTDLEKTDLTSSLHTNMGGHSEVNLIADGKGATLSHTGATSESYVVKIEPGIDPETAVELFQFDVTKKSRKIMVAEMSMGKDKAVVLPKMKLTYKKVADGVYQINTNTQLEAGEYCFMVNRPNISIMGASSPQSLVGYCFSVAGK